MLATLSVASALVAIVSAQTASSTVSQSMPPTATAGFNPNNVTSADAFAWCHAQLNTCPEICGGEVSANSCDQTALTYNCICANGTAPDVSAFTYTLPFYICQETYVQCIAAHPNDAEGQQTCKDNEQCGTRNATALAASASSSSSSAAATSSATAASSSGPSATSAAPSSSSSASSKSGASVNSQHLATGALAAVLMAAFKLVL